MLVAEVSGITDPCVLSNNPFLSAPSHLSLFHLALISTCYGLLTPSSPSLYLTLLTHRSFVYLFIYLLFRPNCNTSPKHTHLPVTLSYTSSPLPLTSPLSSRLLTLSPSIPSISFGSIPIFYLCFYVRSLTPPHSTSSYLLHSPTSSPLSYFSSRFSLTCILTCSLTYTPPTQLTLTVLHLVRRSTCLPRVVRIPGSYIHVVVYTRYRTGSGYRSSGKPQSQG